MAEWLKAHAWKACLRETVTRVRIPLPPPMALCNLLKLLCLLSVIYAFSPTHLMLPSVAMRALMTIEAFVGNGVDTGFMRQEDEA